MIFWLQTLAVSAYFRVSYRVGTFTKGVLVSNLLSPLLQVAAKDYADGQQACAGAITVLRNYYEGGDQTARPAPATMANARDGRWHEYCARHHLVASEGPWVDADSKTLSVRW